MARTGRKKSASGIYHIMVRGINKQNIFLQEEDYLKYLNILGDYKNEIAFDLYAYCLMGNHLHLLLNEGNEDISNIMKRIGVSYVSWFNWQHNRNGHLFQGRFRSEPVENDKYLLAVLRYIHQNPIKAGMVKSIGDYEWSSYREYMGQGEIVNTEYILGTFSKDRKKAVQMFQDLHKREDENTYMGVAKEKKSLSDGEIRELVLKNYKVSLIDLVKEKKELQDEIILYLKKKEGVSLRQLSRLSGLTVHRIYKVE
ncbi:MAG: transposase [Firmicutes bacterium]|nr:transposase [Bacillota bacterium]